MILGAWKNVTWTSWTSPIPRSAARFWGRLSSWKSVSLHPDRTHRPATHGDYTIAIMVMVVLFLIRRAMFLKSWRFEFLNIFSMKVPFRYPSVFSISWSAFFCSRTFDSRIHFIHLSRTPVMFCSSNHYCAIPQEGIDMQSRPHLKMLVVCCSIWTAGL